MESYIKKVKWYFAAICVGLIVIAFFVGNFITHSQYATFGFISRKLKTWEYRMALSDQKSLIARASSIFGNSTEQDVNDGTSASAIPVLVYHGIPDQSDYSEINVPSSVFKDQMFALKKAGYKTIDTNQLYQFMRGEITLPEKSVMVTFDDGRVDSYNFADPILEALNYKAVMFAIGKFPLENEDRGKYYLPASKLQEMEKSGRWDIEAHSYDGHGSGYAIGPHTVGGHFFGDKMWLTEYNRLESDAEFEARIKSDMVKVKDGLGKLLNKDIISFAFPYGDYGQNSSNAASTKNIVLNTANQLYEMVFYQTAPNQRYFYNYPGTRIATTDGNFMLIKRIDINVGWSGDQLIAALNEHKPKNLPYTDNFSTDNGWNKLWGNITINNNQLSLSAQDGEGGATTVLDGTRPWRDYRVKSTVNTPSSSGVYLWLRFQDDDNNVACNFGNGFIHIEQTVNGEHRVIKGIRNPAIKIPTGDFLISGAVKGRTIECNLNNTQSITDQFLDPLLSDGGIGFKTWDEVKGKSRLIVKNLNVVEQ